ncbi:uncharacterized protein LOC126900899 isoform X1 [Daktulosphaira vitifoliae]|uniref:uncharacterized protein LOC126900899 isoform X1 n=1 Tax=Daktulosphaira vitifoliae TaxID=58002 RepID=UPI0021AA7CE1|nr:uncharacterized protein LOC126900899 isoform X1 [Daktulosphaira vitifoliae]
MKFNIILFSLVGCFNYAVGSGSSSAVTNNKQKKTPLYKELISNLKNINNINMDEVTNSLINAGLSQELIGTILNKYYNEINGNIIINDTKWYDFISTLIDDDDQKTLIHKVLIHNCLDKITDCLIDAGVSRDSIDIILDQFYKEGENINLNELLQRIEASNPIPCYKED